MLYYDKKGIYKEYIISVDRAAVSRRIEDFRKEIESW
jgi:hypothetical protein